MLVSSTDLNKWIVFPSETRPKTDKRKKITEPDLLYAHAYERPDIIVATGNGCDVSQMREFNGC